MDIFARFQMQRDDAKALRSALRKLGKELADHPDLTADERQAFSELETALEDAGLQ